MRPERIGFAMCGSFCTFQRVIAELERLCAEYETVIPIFSEASGRLDSRFGKADDFLKQVEALCRHPVLRTVADVEPIGPKKLLDLLVIAPCTGNTLGKLANGITDSSVTMAAKAHLRNDRPVVLGIATNDGLRASAPNIGTLLSRRNFYFVPFGQDDAFGKPTSLIADLSKLNDTVIAALKSYCLRCVTDCASYTTPISYTATLNPKTS